MLQGPSKSDYIVLSAEALALSPTIVARLKPDRVIICRSTIQLLSKTPGLRQHKRRLDRLVAHLIAKGATVLESNYNTPWWLAIGPRSFPVLGDQRPEIRDFQRTQQGTSARFFTCGSIRKVPTKGRETFVNLADWKQTLSEAPLDRETYFLASSYSLRANGMRPFLWRLLLSFVIAYGGLAAAAYGIKALLDDYARFGSLFVGTAILVAGCLVFFWRERARLSYGLFEVMVGWAISYKVYATTGLLNQVPEGVAALQFAAGLYAIVRGLDNVGKGLVGSPAEKYWRRVFNGEALPTKAPKSSALEGPKDSLSTSTAGGHF